MVDVSFRANFWHKFDVDDDDEPMRILFVNLFDDGNVDTDDKIVGNDAGDDTVVESVEMYNALLLWFWLLL